MCVKMLLLTVNTSLILPLTSYVYLEKRKQGYPEHLVQELFGTIERPAKANWRSRIMETFKPTDCNGQLHVAL